MLSESESIRIRISGKNLITRKTRNNRSVLKTVTFFLSLLINLQRFGDYKSNNCWIWLIDVWLRRAHTHDIFMRMLKLFHIALNPLNVPSLNSDQGNHPLPQIGKQASDDHDKVKPIPINVEVSWVRRKSRPASSKLVWIPLQVPRALHRSCEDTIGKQLKFFQKHSIWNCLGKKEVGSDNFTFKTASAVKIKVNIVVRPQEFKTSS